MLTDTQWGRLEPLVEQCRPKGKTPPQDLRRTLTAILWRHENGAKWRAIPADLGPWWRAAQTFIRWAHLGVWERLLLLAQERGVQLGMTFLDGSGEAVPALFNSDKLRRVYDQLRARLEGSFPTALERADRDRCPNTED
jgi:transposase